LVVVSDAALLGREHVGAFEALGMKPGPVSVRQRPARARNLAPFEVLAEMRLEIGEQDLCGGPLVVDVAVDHGSEEA
jgi:hypothetical protein